jgi:tetratricopeptide (TPR) repeat protein
VDAILTTRRRTPVAHASGSPSRLSATDRLRAALAADDLLRAADAAMELGPPARDRLPEPLQPAFDTICDAFTLYESGNDDAAREKLQAVGLSSPFLDWKLLLRGLMAHVAGDDARALDNWSRLADGRLAARLAAPLRFALEPAFRTGHPPAVQTTLQRAGDRLIGGLAPGLRALQGMLARGRMADAFRQADFILPELKRDLPHAADRLGDCFRSAIISTGRPDDIERYRPLFGAPADDPTLARLEALAAEDHHAWSTAHRFWQRFEQSIIDNPAWPAADRDRARALVWCRMARNAEETARAGRRLQPNAEACYKLAIQLAPDLPEPYEQSFLMLRERNRVAQALAAGKRLLKRFPDHANALEAMAELCQTRGELSAALEYAQRAVDANPLDARLRNLLADGIRGRARALAALGNLTAAAADLAKALRLRDGRPDVGILVQAAAVAFKAGDAEMAEERVRQAWAVAPAAAAYALAVEAGRLKLPKPLKQRFDTEFAATLAAPPTGPTAAALAAGFLEQCRHGNYVGQKVHEKKVQTFVEAAVTADPGEADLVRLCERCRDLNWMRLLKKAASRGQKRFPKNPFFPFFEAAVHLIEDRLYSPATWKVEPLLEKSRRLAAACASDESVRQLLRDLDDIQRRLAVPAPVVHMLNELFDMFDEG